MSDLSAYVLRKGGFCGGLEAKCVSGREGSMLGGIQERGKTRFLKYLIFGTNGIADIWGDGNYRYKANVKSYTEKKK